MLFGDTFECVCSCWGYVLLCYLVFSCFVWTFFSFLRNIFCLPGKSPFCGEHQDRCFAFSLVWWLFGLFGWFHLVVVQLLLVIFGLFLFLFDFTILRIFVFVLLIHPLFKSWIYCMVPFLLQINMGLCFGARSCLLCLFLSSFVAVGF